MISFIVIGIVMGVVFGFALEKSRVFEPGVIVRQMQLTNFLMLKVFMTAMLTSLVVIAIMISFSLGTFHPKPTIFGADIVGGLLMGIGLSLTGACPGTVLAQVGAGYKDALFTLLGGFFGAWAFIYLYPLLKPWVAEGGFKNLTLDQILHLPFLWVVLIVGFVLVMGLVFLERRKSWRQEIGINLDGV